MADINERVVVETDQSVANLGELKSAAEKADEWIDNVIDRARAADKEEITVPVETPGATEAADQLDKVDASARKAGGGAKVGVQDIGDLTGPLGDASGAASTFGQAFGALGPIAEGVAGKLGLSEEHTSKLTGLIGGLGVAVGIGAAAWTYFSAEADKAQKTADEVRDSLGKVYDKLREGDAQAAAQTFVDTMGDKIGTFQKTLGDVSKQDVAGAIFGDPASIRNVDDAISHMDGTAKLVAEGTLKTLAQSWTDAKTAVDDNTALQDKVVGFFGVQKTKADDTTTAIDKTTAAYQGLSAAAGAATALPIGAHWDVTGNPSSTVAFDPAAYAAAHAGVVNIFPPANTPIAVDQAIQRNDQLQGPR